MVCVFSGRGDCEGRLDLHHILPRQHIKRAFPLGQWLDTKEPIRRSEWLDPNRPLLTLQELLDSRANLAVICRRHHELLENRRIYLDPPDDAVRFAVSLGLESVLLKQRERAA